MQSAIRIGERMIEPVVASTDNIVLVKCKACEGLLLCMVEKFMSDRDTAEVEQARRAGNRVQLVPKGRNVALDSCHCASPGRSEVAAPRASKPILSLKHRSA